MLVSVQIENPLDNIARLIECHFPPHNTFDIHGTISFLLSKLSEWNHVVVKLSLSQAASRGSHE